MIEQIEFSLSERRRGVHLITSDVLAKLPKLPEKGMLHLFIQHTSAALSINENADPTVRTDMHQLLNHLVPERQPFFDHNDEGDDDMPAHAKASLIGSSITIPITRGRLNMGIWQGIYLCEFRNRGGARRFVATILG